MNKYAPQGTVFVCRACGRRSRDMNGDLAIDDGWDESCRMYSILVIESSLERDAKGFVLFANLSNAEPLTEPACAS